MDVKYRGSRPQTILKFLQTISAERFLQRICEATKTVLKLHLSSSSTYTKTYIVLIHS
jgi:hypothetical protein